MPMKPILLLAALLVLSPQANAQPEEGQVPVDFEGEEEVTFEEEETDQSTPMATPVPEYHYQCWLLILPLICIGLLAWNVAPARNKK